MLFAPRLEFGGRGTPSYARRAPLILINGQEAGHDLSAAG
jgi:hypothetical protein